MFKTPNSKTITNAAVVVGSGVVGAKVSDGVVAIIPESAQKYAKGIVLAAALIGAASVNSSTTTGTAVQSAFVGMAIKQGADMLTEAIKPQIAAKESSSVANRFINAVVGHNDTDGAIATIEGAAVERFALNSPYEMATEVPQRVAVLGV